MSSVNYSPNQFMVLNAVSSKSAGKKERNNDGPQDRNT
jgi:hypothetical protein